MKPRLVPTRPSQRFLPGKEVLTEVRMGSDPIAAAYVSCREGPDGHLVVEVYGARDGTRVLLTAHGARQEIEVEELVPGRQACLGLKGLGKGRLQGRRKV